MTIAPFSLHELTAVVADAQTFDQWKNRGEPLNCFAHFGIVKNWYDAGAWCRTVLLEHSSDVIGACLVA
jgi:hypothetical protein